MALRISRRGCTRGRPSDSGAGRWGSMQVHSASDGSVWYALLMLGRGPSDLTKHPFQTVSYADNGAHPFTVLYWAAHALDHLGALILLGGDPETTSCMGLKRA